MNRKEISEWIKSIVLAIIISIIIKTYILNTTYVLGYSMYPTLHEKDRLFTNKLGYIIGEPKKGDIVVLEAPDDPDKDYIKRIIGLEGDVIEIIDGEVLINGEKLNEDYLDNAPYTYAYENNSWEVPEDSVFVLGDNRNKWASKDSRHLGYIPIDSIKGKAIFRWFPFDNRFGSVYK